jgi:hypothetical protein
MSKPQRVAASLLLLTLGLGPAVAAAEETEDSQKSGFVTQWMPPSVFYPMYLADPTRPVSGVTGMKVDSEIPDTGDSRFALHLGGRFAIVRFHPQEDTDRGWQIDIEAAFLGHFDTDRDQDNIGWDGVYAVYLSWLPNSKLALRIGSHHVSAHIGDEYAERTGRERIGYTREEAVFGVGYRPSARWLIYGETGFGSGPKGTGGTWQAQAGVELHGKQRFWKGRMGWYAALDLRTYEETDWSTRASAQIGLMLPTGRGTSRWRLAAEYGSGRSVMGEFSFYDETYVRFGLFYDF